MLVTGQQLSASLEAICLCSPLLSNPSLPRILIPLSFSIHTKAIHESLIFPIFALIFLSFDIKKEKA
jgi:hypothetical protein